jgi:hypothetical protein
VTQIDNRSDRRLNQHDHHRKKHAQVTYQHPLKINNSNTYPCIPIRWNGKGGSAEATLSILDQTKFDLEGADSAC